MSFRPPSSAARRPGTGLRPGSGYNRPMTGFKRLDTANGQAPMNGASVGLETNVNVQARPLTQHGITGIQTGFQSKRKVADSTYYENLLKQKLSEIVTEISKMENILEMDQASKDQITKFEKDRNVLMSQVRELEGKLADYNLALDKMRSGANIEELRHACNEIKMRNEREKGNVDSVYLGKKKLETDIESVFKDITNLNSNIEASFENQDSSNYRLLFSELRSIDMLFSEKEKELNEIEHKYNSIRNSLSNNDKYSNNVKALRLEKEINLLNGRKSELQNELRGNLDADTIKNNILLNVKKHNALLADTKQELHTMETRIEEANLTLTQKERDLETMKQNLSQSDKFEKLFETETKMTKFIQNYQTSVEQLLSQKSELEHDVVGLMRYMSTSGDGAKSKFEEMKDDVTRKLAQKQQSEQTLAHIIKEKEEATKYLERIENLDTKIPQEIEKLETDMNDMKEEMATFKSNEECQEKFKQDKMNLLKQKMKYQQSKESMEKKVSELAIKLDKMKQELHSNAYHAELSELENKITKLSANIFIVEENIAEHKREGNYEPIMQSVLMLHSEINDLLIKQVALNRQ